MSKKPDQTHEWVNTFYHDLQQLVDTTFPKTCSMCGKIYPTKDAFLTETLPVKDLDFEDRSGLFSPEIDRVESAIAVFRNCVCGSTLMADFKDRRDNSDEGKSRRERFDALMDTLSEKGISSTDARREILKVLHGETSNLIAELLDDVKLP